MKISFYKKYNSVSAQKVDLQKAIDSIKDGTYSEQIKNVRLYSNDKTKRDLEKKKLPLLGFSGLFTTRGNDNLIQSSGIACLDYDHVDNLVELIEKVNQDSFTFISFISPSGNGLKVLVKIPFVSNDKDYKSFYHELQKHYDAYSNTDDATKDISRATYVSFDPDLFQNIESETFTDRFVPKEITKQIINIPLSNIDDVADKILVWFNKKWTTGQNRNNNLFILASSFNDYGVLKSTALNYCLSYATTSFNEREINGLVNSAYKDMANFGTKFFEDNTKVNMIKRLASSGAKLEHIIKEVGDTDGVVVEFNKVVSKLSIDEFWYYTEKEVIKLATFRFLNYLENNNISKYYPDENSDLYLFIKKDNNFVSDFGESKIKDFTLSDLRNRGVIDAFELMANNNNNFSPKYLSMIKTTDVVINKDTKDSSFIYYKNAAVKTTKDNIEIINYKDINDLIWKNQIIDRDIILNDESDGEFKTFIWLVSGKNINRYYTLKTVIGYLLHSYQDESKPKSIIFNDEMISEDIPNGGSGKGLIHKAIGHIKNIVIEDGKKFDPRGQFAYQKVNKDTQIFLMDDVPKNFNFESLFSIITEGMTVEKKGQDAYQIPFRESPKISITTNYTIKGDGASFYRRVFEVEIANYFNDKYTPEDEFKHQFFTEWSNNEWAKFDNFMIRCVQFFLKNGLIESNKINLEFRKLKNDLGQEFIEFMELQVFNGKPINRKDFRDNFNKQYPVIAKFNTPQKFNKKVKDYCSYNKIVFEESKYNGIVCFYIGEKEEVSDDEPF